MKTTSELCGEVALKVLEDRKQFTPEEREAIASAIAAAVQEFAEGLVYFAQHPGEEDDLDNQS